MKPDVDIEKFAMVALLRIFSEQASSVRPRWAMEISNIFICTFCGASLESLESRAWESLNHLLSCPVLQVQCLLKKWDNTHG